MQHKTLAVLALERLLVVAERCRASVDDPDVIVGVHTDANRGSEDPMIRERLGPERVDFESRRLHGAFRLRGGGALEERLPDAERSHKRDSGGADPEDSHTRLAHARSPLTNEFQVPGSKFQVLSSRF